jgi:hypothetical protein
MKMNFGKPHWILFILSIALFSGISYVWGSHAGKAAQIEGDLVSEKIFLRDFLIRADIMQMPREKKILDDIRSYLLERSTSDPHDRQSAEFLKLVSPIKRR